MPPEFFVSVNSSSRDDNYTVSFYLTKKETSVQCTCKAGEYGKLCKHILAVMTGDKTMLCDEEEDGPVVDQITKYLSNTPVAPALCEWLKTKKQIEVLQKLEDAQKRELMSLLK